MLCAVNYTENTHQTDFNVLTAVGWKLFSLCVWVECTCTPSGGVKTSRPFQTSWSAFLCSNLQLEDQTHTVSKSMCSQWAAIGHQPFLGHVVPAENPQEVNSLLGILLQLHCVLAPGQIFHNVASHKQQKYYGLSTHSPPKWVWAEWYFSSWVGSTHILIQCPCAS